MKKKCCGKELKFAEKKILKTLLNKKQSQSSTDDEPAEQTPTPHRQDLDLRKQTFAKFQDFLREPGGGSRNLKAAKQHKKQAEKIAKMQGPQ